MLISREIQFHYIRSRVKTKVSTVRKLANPTKSYTGISDLTDMLGVRIVTYFPDDVDRVAKMIRDEFSIDEENSTDKRASLDPDRFGYLSLHYVASLAKNRVALAEYARFADFTFEIQIRSILQHAWAEIEHDLGYKASNAIPVEVRRRFSRIAGLLEVADNEFQEIRNYLTKHQQRVEAADRRQWKGVAIDQDSVYAFMRREIAARALDRRLARGVGMSLSRPTRQYAGSRQAELKKAGFQSLADVKHEIELYADPIVKFAHSWISDLGTPGLWPRDADVEEFGWHSREEREPDEADDEVDESDDDFTVLPSGVGLFYLWLYKCAKGDVDEQPYHDVTMESLKRKFEETREG
ncbi:GTP pyrophosphokinase family protein [Streptomyces bobili]|uniref:GTP pyrophosphokinase n=1 Tax=Streptomyces bobili TaxID=67280 RepID=UPI0036F7F766